MTRKTDLVLRSAAIVLMLAGVGMIFTGSTSALAIAIITLGLAIVAILQIGKVCNRPSDRDVGHGGHA